jgi:hypothetical protein
MVISRDNRIFRAADLAYKCPIDQFGDVFFTDRF